MRFSELATHILLIGSVSVVGIVYVVYSAFAQVASPPATVAFSTVLFKVEPGETTAEIASNLTDNGLVRNDLLFRLLVSRRGLDGSLQAGEYLLRPNMSLDEIIDELLKGRVINEVVTILEGWRSEEIAEALAARGLIDPDEFLRIVTNGLAEFDYEFLPPPGSDSTLEGFLFPDTYEVGPQTTARDFVEKMLERFDQVYTAPMREAAVRRGLSALEVVNLAAIVEREAVLDEERPIIASVFFNRLERGMKLEADPTVQYAVASRESFGTWWKQNLTFDDLATNSAYNTYVVPALPRGPIANPGISSILAVLEPDDTSFLFFVARGDGSHAFAETLEEHQQNVQRFIR